MVDVEALPATARADTDALQRLDVVVLTKESRVVLGCPSEGESMAATTIAVLHTGRHRLAWGSSAVCNRRMVSLVGAVVVCTYTPIRLACEVPELTALFSPVGVYSGDSFVSDIRHHDIKCPMT